jgi:curli biogenesis system outer membrane secretion channel CsgG
MYSLLSLMALLTASCAMQSSISVQMMKPATIHLSGVHKLAIADFQGIHNSGGKIAADVQSMLMETPHFDMLERDKLNKVLDEQKLGMTGVLDEATARKIGKMAGVDAMIFGEVTTYQVEPDERGVEKVEKKVGTGKYEEVDEKNIFTGKTKRVKREIMQTVLVDQRYRIRRGSAAIHFRVVDVETGKLLAVHSDNQSYTSDKVIEGGSTSLKPEGEILDDLSKVICRRFVQLIAPHFVQEQRSIEPGKGSIQAGKKYAEAGLWPEALKEWKQAVEEFPKDPVAFYNLGLAYEVQGDLDQAEANYKTAVSFRQKRLYLDAINRIRQEKIESDRLKEQLQDR